MTKRKLRRTRLEFSDKVALVEKPGECPKCNGKVRQRIPRGQNRVGTIRVCCHCQRCGARWKEYYALHDIVGVRGPNKR